MHSTFTSSHTLWTTTKTWLATARSATCYTTTEKSRLDMIYQGNTSTHGFSSGVYITTADRNHLEKAWVKMLNSKNYLGN
jgi:hypothetical protein